MRGQENNLNFHIESTGSPNQQECDFGKKVFPFCGFEIANVHIFLLFRKQGLCLNFQRHTDFGASQRTCNCWWIYYLAQVHLNRNYWWGKSFSHSLSPPRCFFNEVNYQMILGNTYTCSKLFYFFWAIILLSLMTNACNHSCKRQLFAHQTESVYLAIFRHIMTKIKVFGPYWANRGTENK